ncbi:glycosyl transferase family protein [Pseudoroseicyclus aestuarii]|uniref:Anthranilate phosphoribosyltransferase n=1 Tax=Pseudoroseicyclus aestuarii TaxID=1795041 RepID=A0A318SUH7_9RHOB|nr:glycosyl transferase family protein [Pseudoroseicyclus aestuarii]PYE84029.1 anthranilate phosphoribosyltransferase [Pseudoroseicyclus aestuarii]
MTLRHAVATLGRGPGRSRSLDMAEAEAAMAEVLSGEAAPEALGALLMLLRMKGETADEVAGFTRAMRAALPDLPTPALDWPVYAAGRTRGLPWFLFAARRVAEAGHPVLLHGWTVNPAPLEAGLKAARIPVVTPGGAADALARHRIAFLPLEALSPALLRLLQLREVFGLRSCVNTCLRMLNPGAAPAMVQGVFHPSYRMLQAEAAQRLGQPSLTAIKGGGGEFERTPVKEVELIGLRGGHPWQATAPALLAETRRLADAEPDLAQLAAPDPGPFARAVIEGTAALAFDTLGLGADAAGASPLRMDLAPRPIPDAPLSRRQETAR